MNIEKLVMRTAIAVFLLCVGMVATAQTTRLTECSQTTPNNALCIRLTPPSTHTDGSPVVLPITYRFEQRTGTTGTWATIANNVTAPRFYVQNLAPGTYYFRVYANCPTCTAESAASNEADGSATRPPQVPNPPVITIAVVIGLNHAPVYRLTQAGKRDERYREACGFIPVGIQCQEQTVFRFRENNFKRVSAAEVKEWSASCGEYVAAPCA